MSVVQASGTAEEMTARWFFVQGPKTAKVRNSMSAATSSRCCLVKERMLAVESTMASSISTAVSTKSMVPCVQLDSGNKIYYRVHE